MTKKEAIDLFYKNYYKIKQKSREVQNELKDRGEFHEDITHEFYLKIVDELEKIEEKPDQVIKFIDRFFWGKTLKIYRIIKNMYVHFLRRENKYVPFDFSNISVNERKKLITKAKKLDLEGKTIDQKVDDVVDSFYWFDKKLFNLYRYDFKTHKSKMSKATKISISTIYRTVKRCKVKINKALRNEYYKK